MKPTDERYTLTRIFDQLYKHALRAGIELQLDVCATAESAKLPGYYTAEQDGLKQPWDVPYYMNPPWSNVRPFLQKAIYTSCHSRGPPGLLLLPAWSDRPWWQELLEPLRDPADLFGGSYQRGPKTRFTPRLRFGVPGDPERDQGSPNFWCVLVTVGLWPSNIRNWYMEW